MASPTMTKTSAATSSVFKDRGNFASSPKAIGPGAKETFVDIVIDSKELMGGLGEMPTQEGKTL